jgi:hypothetical protein
MFRKLAFFLPVVFFAGDPGPAAAVEYCAEFFDGQRSCGIPTYQGCLDTVSGVGGECIEDQFGAIPKGLMQQLMEKRREEWQTTPPAVRDLEAVPPPPQ